MMRGFAATLGCLAIGAVLWTASATAAPVGLIEEFDVDGWAYSLTPGPGGEIWFTFDRDPIRIGDAAIGRITSRGEATFFKAGLDRRSALGNMVVGADGNLWFADHGKRPAIGRITPQGQITEFRIGLEPKSKPGDLVAGPDGNIWFVDGGATPGIGRVTPDGGISEFSAGLNPGSVPGEIVAGADGNLWFNNRSTTAAVGRITPQGVIAEFGPGPVPGGGAEVGPVLGPDGNVWFAIGSYKSLGIGRITPAGAITGFGGISPQTRSLGPFAAGPDGNVWFTARGLEEYDAQGNRVTSGYSTAIGRVTPSGEVTTFGECLHTGPQYTGPNSIAAGPDGNVWFTNHTTRSLPNIGTPPAIGRITPGGEITEYRAGMLYASSPDGIVAGPDGALWFTDRELKAIGRLVPSSAPPNTVLVRPARRAGRNGATSVTIAVPGPGALKVEQLGLLSARNRLTRFHRRSAAADAPACGAASVPIALKGIARKRLRRYGFVTLKARVTFTPAGGSPYSEYASIDIALRRR
jgi:virginiamycin B lyase